MVTTPSVLKSLGNIFQDNNHLMCMNEKARRSFRLAPTIYFRSYPEDVAISITGEEFKTNYGLNCDRKCLIHLLSCNKFSIQYTGKTIDIFRLRWSNYNSKNNEILKTKILHAKTYIWSFLWRL